MPTFSDFRSQFSDAIARAGLPVPAEIIADGNVHRFSTNNKPHDQAGWYCLHADGLPAGAFGCWRAGISEKWHAQPDRTLTAPEQTEYRRRLAEIQAARDAEEQQRHREAATKAATKWASARPAPDNHPYLQRKGITAHGARLSRNALVIPVRNADGVLTSLQFISADGDKLFLTGGKVQGGYFPIGEPSNTLCIAEGFATAASIQQATGYPVAVAFNAGNLLPVARSLRAKHPDLTIIVCGDDDYQTPNNPGLTKAKAAASAINARLVVPDFGPDRPEGATDFNDLHKAHGLDTVRRQIDAATAGAVADQPTGWTTSTSGRREQPADDLDPYRGTDDSNADLFLRLHGDDVRYCPPWEKWLLWTGTHWQIDDALRVATLAADVPRELYRRAANAMDSKDRRAIADLARKLEHTTRRNAMLSASKHRVVIHHSDLDRGHFLLNASNGTIDLTTGTLREHYRNDWLTHDTGIVYDPAATAPTWLQFLSDVFLQDADLIYFVQRAVGYSLTGDVREQVLLICHGTGSNGKSVFLNILRRLVGNLARQAMPDLLLQNQHTRHPTEQADLFGKRLVICQETGEGRRFNETLVKQLTGGDAISARRMHEDPWNFEPTHKLWMSTNHRPVIKGTDHAIWRRMRLIPFAVAFKDDSEPRKDAAMESRLLAELPGILAWAVAGCLAWQQVGLRQAAAVAAATAAYRADMDVLGGWLEDCCTLHPAAKCKAADLYQSYVAWSEANGERPEPQRAWGIRLTERGLESYSGGLGYKWWRGIGLLKHVDDVDDVDQKTRLKPAELVQPVLNSKSGQHGQHGQHTQDADKVRPLRPKGRTL